MTDIATLGLKVDSTQVTAASAALDKLAASAKPATAAAGNLEKAAAGATTNLAANAKATANTAAAHAGMSTQAMAASHSIRSMAEMLAMGIPPSQILASQMNHLSYAATGPGGIKGAFAEAIGTLRQFITPTTLVVGGLAAVGAAFYLVNSAIKTTELEFGNLAERSGVAMRSLHELESAAAFKGIDTSDFLKGMQRFSELTADAVHNTGSLADMFRANNVQVGNIDDNLMRAADLIKNARTEADKYRLIQQLGLPATREWVQYLSQGSDELRKARDGAAKFGDVASEQLIAKARAFDEAWARGWKNFTTYAKQAFLETKNAFSELDTTIGQFYAKYHPKLASQINLGESFASVNSYSNSALQAALENKAAQLRGGGTTKNPDDARNDISRDQQRIALLGQLATVQDAIHAKENEINLAGLAGVKIRQDQVEALKRIAEFQAESAKIQKSAQYGIVDPTRAAANAKLELQTLIDDKTVRSADDYAAAVAVITKRLKEMSDQAAVARSPFEQLTRYAIDGMNATKQFDTFATQSMGHLENGLADFITGTKSAKEAFRTMAQSILRDLTQMIIRMQITGPLAKALGGAFGFMGGGGAAAAGGGPIANGFFAGAHSGAIVGSEATFMRAANPAIFAGAPKFHTGGVAGDEVPIIAKKGEGIFTPAQMKALAPAGGGGAAPVVNVTNNNTYTFTGVEPGMEARMRAYIDQGDQRSVRQSVDAVAKVSSNTPAYRAPFK